ncbi:MAG TPA: hypothetical protein VJT67_17485 [Longimicrobiaceae bacterium]|nr:hypothetical protein [Longimicrobiaceae bacterium]
MKGWTFAALAIAAAPTVAGAQSVACGAQSMLTGCPVAYQALASAAPQFGIAAAAGSAVPGVEGTRGLTLGIIPKTTATLRVSGAAAHLPDTAAPDGEETATPIAVKLGTASRVFEGSSAGTGAFDLLFEAGLLTNTGEGGRTAAVLAAGARLGLLRETFAAPGIAVSGVWRHVGPLQYGSSCGTDSGCVGFSTQAAFGVNDVSARLTIGKRVGPVGLLAGGGWDHFATTHGAITYHGSGGFEPTSGTVAVDVTDSRWSAFANLSKNLLIGSAVAELGWMSGGDAVTNFAPGPGGFDPGQGTFFGSVALRFQL